MQWAHKQKGFTIVELLIVVVVIAILAAITIVAYNGIQNRAKDSSLQSSASQAGKKLLSYAPINTDLYPTESDFATSSFRTSTLNLAMDTDQATYNYYVSDDRKSFCVSVANTTASPVIAYAFTQEGKIVQGRCVKNLITNPSFETNTTSWGNGNAVTSGVSNVQKKSGNSSMLVTRTGTTDDFVVYNAALVPGKNYTFSSWLYANADGATGSSRHLWLYNQSGGTAIVDFPYSAPYNTWRQVSQTNYSPINATLTIRVYAITGASLYIDAVMITENSEVYAYGDGSLANWSWTGTPNASMSFGPAIAQ